MSVTVASVFLCHNYRICYMPLLCLSSAGTTNFHFVVGAIPTESGGQHSAEESRGEAPVGDMEDKV